MKITLKTGKQPLITARQAMELVTKKLNDAVHNDGFFSIKGNNINFGSFANDNYFRVLSAFALMAEEYVYVSIGCGNENRISSKNIYQKGWLDVWNLVRDIDLDMSKVELEVQ